MENAVYKYLKLLKLPVSVSYCKKLLVSHPDNPAILSIADTFDRLGLDYVVGRKSRESLSEIPFPYLIHSNAPDILLIRNEKDIKKYDQELSDWSGVIIKVNEESQVVDPIHNRQYENEKQRLWMSRLAGALALVLIVVALVSNLSLMAGFWALTALAGIGVAYLLLEKELGKESKQLNDFCGNSEKVNCNAVLQSDGAKLFWGIKLTDLVAGYFATQFAAVVLVSLAPALADPLFATLTLVALAALAVVAYSLFYQAFVVKVWCKLCLLVSSVLLIQSLAIPAFSLMDQPLTLTLHPESLLFLALGFEPLTVCLVLWRQKQNSIADLEDAQFMARRNLQSPDVFSALLNREPQVTEVQAPAHSVLGNPEARISMTLSLNTMCDPCRKLFGKINDLLAVHADIAKIELVFVRGMEDEELKITPNQYLTQYWLNHLKGKPDESAQTLQFVRDWYDLMDLPALAKKYPLDIAVQPERARKLVDAHEAWLFENHIQRSPALFFAQRRVPHSFEIDLLTSVIFFINADISNEAMTQEA